MTKLQTRILEVFKQYRRALDPREVVMALAGGIPKNIRFHPSATAKAMRKMTRMGLLIAEKDGDFYQTLASKKSSNPVPETTHGYVYRLNRGR
jgi:hypothetical protein